MHTAKCLFAVCQNKGTRQKTSLPSARKKTLGKDAFCRVPKNGTLQNKSLPSAKKNTRQSHLCRVPKKNIRQSRLCRVPDKIHSAKLPALGKVPVSGSVMLYKSRLSKMPLAVKNIPSHPNTNITGKQICWFSF